ncbi:MAG: GWxTD domain-containing protein [Thermoanaerobaculaceae bacterium]
MGKYAATGLVFLALGIPTISAETPASVSEMLRGPVGYLFTKEERKALENLKSEADINQFMELFWAKRDPDLNTQVNEFKVDFEARVKAADKMFTLERMLGSLTDRGRVLILLGKPTRATNIPAGSVVEGARGGEGGRQPYEDRGATEIWVYSKDRLPEGIVKADEVWVVFTETRVGSNEFILDRTDRRNVAIMKILTDLPQKLIKNPKLTEVPKLGLLPGSKAAKPEELALLEKGEVWPDGTGLVVAQGLVSANFKPLWLFLQLPDPLAPAASVVGRVLTEQGQELGTFSGAVTPLSVTGGRGYEFSLPLDAGKFRVDLALLDASGTPLVVKSLPVELQPVPEDGTVISQFYWGVDVRQEASAHLGDPFNIGGWHVIPRASNAYNSSENLAYFCYILHPQLDENGKADFVVSLAAYKDNKKLTENPNQPVNLSQVTGDLWMFGNGLPLSVFRKEGEYVLEVTLRDARSNVERKARIPLVIAGQ